MTFLSDALCGSLQLRRGLDAFWYDSFRLRVILDVARLDAGRASFVEQNVHVLERSALRLGVEDVDNLGQQLANVTFNFTRPKR